MIIIANKTVNLTTERKMLKLIFIGNIGHFEYVEFCNRRKSLRVIYAINLSKPFNNQPSFVFF